ncbi:MAG: hypothetical protein JWM99_948 [Verrucomicrobiales bacterium]|nr:hypothetical protein [Verrucomicrobiales bacterium]
MKSFVLNWHFTRGVGVACCGLEIRAPSGMVDMIPSFATSFAMEKIIYPRSPRETMSGWVYLPRFVDKIRLHLAGKLHPEYQENFTKGFDGGWLKAAGLTSDQFIEVVHNTITDGEVADWVRVNVKKSDAEKQTFATFVLNRGNDADDARERLRTRKADAGLAHRDDIKTFVDFIDADEKRL